jgi:hypothetical protein
MQEQETRALFSLAQQFVEQQAYQQAAQCLLVLCNQSSLLPSTLAQARMQLATLLLDHFDNLQEAKALLLAAVGTNEVTGWQRPPTFLHKTQPPSPAPACEQPVHGCTSVRCSYKCLCRIKACVQRAATTCFGAMCGRPWRAATSA